MEKIKKEKFKIAVIEDDEVISKSLCGELEDAGFETIRAFNGLEGLKLVLSKSPDLILLDIVMPKMDGMTMMAKLRESSDYGKNVPVILLTNLNADDKIMHGVVKDEPAYYLVKNNFSAADVVEKVRERLSARPDISAN
jgi:DNA-binding response OmpR family regulator